MNHMFCVLLESPRRGDSNISKTYVFLKNNMGLSMKKNEKKIHDPRIFVQTELTLYRILMLQRMKRVIKRVHCSVLFSYEEDAAVPKESIPKEGISP